MACLEKYFPVSVQLTLIFLLITSISLAQFAGGEGTENDPYQVATAAQLNEVRNFPEAHFIQTADIDLGSDNPEGEFYNNGEGWLPISTFSGTYNGQDHIISGLYINRSGSDNMAFFAEVSGSESALTNIIIDTADVTGKEYTGILAGSVRRTRVENCKVSGQVSAFEGSFTSLYNGGMIGQARYEATIIGCSFSGEITTNGELLYTGGLVGEIDGVTIQKSRASGTISGDRVVGGLVGDGKESEISECYFYGDIIAESNAGGGFIGDASTETFITDCYARGTVSGSNSMGGFAGQHDNCFIQRCYASVTVTGENQKGGFSGSGSPTSISNSFWDTDTSGLEDSFGGEGRQASAMTYPFVTDIFPTWDFEEVWGSSQEENDGYPFLQWQGFENEGSGNIESISFEDGTGTSEDPYQIATADQLHAVRYFIDAHYVQIQDIDLGSDDPGGDFYNNGEGWSPISRFSGTYDGNGHAITGLYINRPEASVTGLFGYIDSPEGSENIAVDDLHLNEVTITGGEATGALAGTIDQAHVRNVRISGLITGEGEEATGGIAGNMTSTTITAGEVNGTVNGNNITGGLVGEYTSSQSDTTGIYQSFFEGQISGQGVVGGLIGTTGRDHNILISESYADATIEATGESAGGLVGIANPVVIERSFFSGEVIGTMRVGGLIGYADDNGAYVQDSYTIGSVSGEEQIGGIAGHYSQGLMKRSYAAGRVSGNAFTGGLIGEAGPENLIITTSFWDSTTTGQQESPGGGKGKSTGKMTYPFSSDIYLGWDFEDVWGANQDNNEGYPFLQWQGYTNEGAGNIEPLFEAGSGTAEDPYEVATPEQLNAVRHFKEAHFLQVADIDLASGEPDSPFYNEGAGWAPIQDFMGSYDGDHHTISGLFINRDTTDNAGLFGHVYHQLAIFDNWELIQQIVNQEFIPSDTEIKNLTLEDVQVTGQDFTGGLIGRSDYVTVSNVDLTGNVQGNNETGGLIGAIDNFSLVQQTSAKGNVTGNEMTGGLVGHARMSRLNNNYTHVEVIGSVRTGGIIGQLLSVYSTDFGYFRSILSDSYTASTITSGEESRGTVIGANGEEGSTPGGYIENVYWDQEVAPGENPIGVGYTESDTIDLAFGGEVLIEIDVQGRTTEKMTYPIEDENTYTNWDFEEIWAIAPDTNEVYPYLRKPQSPALTVSETEIVVEQSADSSGYTIELSTVPLHEVQVVVSTTCDVLINGNPGSDTLIFQPDKSVFEPREVVLTTGSDSPQGELECQITHSVSSEDPEYDGYNMKNVSFRRTITEEDPPITIYNAIAPNGDGKNEFLYIENIEYYEDNRVAVFNRWGDLITRIEGYDNQTNHWKPSDDVEDGQYHVVVTLGEATENETSFLVIKR